MKNQLQVDHYTEREAMNNIVRIFQRKINGKYKLGFNYIQIKS
jgi:hypothetical protein